jgi:NAD(P)-dependent dehydrogenase (short-subunit alcohol dehydrogenase family)
VPCDVANEAGVAVAVRATVERFGRLDMAFNNAGIQVPPSDAADEPAEVFDPVEAQVGGGGQEKRSGSPAMSASRSSFGYPKPIVVSSRENAT